MEFKTIAEPTRLLVGDLVTVPSESGSARRRVHLTPNALSKHGISIGFTSRSDNKPETVERMLSRDTGKARTMWVSSTVLKHYYNVRERKYRNMVGNLGSSDTVIEPVKTACLYALPCPDLKGKELVEACLFWAREHKDLVSGALEGHILGRDLIRQFSDTFESSPDGAMAETFESMYGNPEQLNTRCLDNYLPMGNIREIGRDNALTAEQIRDKFLRSSCFMPEGLDDDDHGTWVTARFLQWYHANGVAFRRPDADFMRNVSRFAASALMEEYVRRQGGVMRSVAKYLARLKTDMASVKDRAKRGSLAAKKMALVKRETERTFGRLS